MKQWRLFPTTNGYIPRVQRFHTHSRVPQSDILRAATADRRSNRRGSAQQATRLYSFLLLRQMLPLNNCTPQRAVSSIRSHLREQPNKRLGRSSASAPVGRPYEAGRAHLVQNAASMRTARPRPCPLSQQCHRTCTCGSLRHRWNSACYDLLDRCPTFQRPVSSLCASSSH